VWRALDGELRRGGRALDGELRRGRRAS
jgi:hypothetical protein